MAALLRHAAGRRIAGSVLQRTQAAVTSPAVAEERRRLVTRRLYSTEEFMTLVNDLFPNNPEEQAHGGIAREIQQKKDELYDLIIKGEQDVRTSTWPNAWLLTHLSEEVTPRPSDSIWCDLKTTRKAFSGIKRAGLFSLTFVAVDYYTGCSNDKKVAPAMMMEEEHEAREVETGSHLMAMEI